MGRQKLLEDDAKYLAVALIRGTGERRLRIAKGSGSAFDLRAVEAVEAAKRNVGWDVSDPDRKRALGERVFFSLCESVPYSHMGECFCCENKFYSYRREFCLMVAEKMGFI